MFRGKRIDGLGCMYGDLYHQNDRCYIYPKGARPDLQVRKWSLEVHPDSVGQSTGKKDARGVVVYEKDIVKFPDHDYLAEVVYCPEFAAFMFESHNKETRNNPDAIMSWGSELEVIGNIHDNPELLKENKDVRNI